MQRPHVLVRTGNALLTLLGGYGLLLTALLLVRLVTGESFVLIAIFNHTLPAALLIALAFALLALGLRRWRVFVAQLPGVLALILSYPNVFLPPTRDDAPADARRLTLVTLNVDRTVQDFDAIAALLRDLNADVVALQEVTPLAADELANALSDLYPHTALFPTADVGGLGVFSRVPLRDAPPPSDARFQQVTLDAGVTLYNAHPRPPFLTDGALFSTAPRGSDITRLLEHAAGVPAPLPVVLAGDFNMTDQTDDYQRIVALYSDAFRAAGGGLGLTFPDWMPITRLDYVFTGAGVRAVEARVWYTSGGNSHYPLVVTLVLTGVP